ncbi:MAG: hypothetical protein ACP5I8_00720 [Phycisphaerae bacterium]
MKTLLYRVSQSELLLPIIAGAIVGVLLYDVITLAYLLGRWMAG